LSTLEQLVDRLQIDQLEHLLLPAGDACGVLAAILGFNSCGNPRWLLQKKSGITAIYVLQGIA